MCMRDFNSLNPNHGKWIEILENVVHAENRFDFWLNHPLRRKNQITFRNIYIWNFYCFVLRKAFSWKRRWLLVCWSWEIRFLSFNNVTITTSFQTFGQFLIVHQPKKHLYQIQFFLPAFRILLSHIWTKMNDFSRN